MSKFVTVTCGLILITAAGCSRPEAKEPAPANKSDAKACLKWAKEGAEAFLTAVRDKKDDQAALLLSAELTKKVLGIDEPRFLDLRVQSRWGERWQLSSWSFKSEEIAPDRNEASFKGTLVSLENGEAEFVLRMVKEKDNGLWRVNFVSDGKWQKQDRPLKK